MFKKKVYSDFVELSIGKVYIKPLTNKVLNRALSRSTVIKAGVNNAVFLDYCERKMTQLRFWQWGSLTIKDGNVLREKIKELLKEDGIIKEEVKTIEKESDVADLNKVISPQDQQWFSRARARMGGN
jgi:ribosomal protein L19E